MSEHERVVLDASAEIDELDEATVIVERDVDETVVVDRRTVRGPDIDDDGATVVVVRSTASGDGEVADADDEATRVVVRAESVKPKLTHAAEQIMKAPTRRDRRRPAPAPVSEDVLRTAETGIGPGLAETYGTREVEVSRPSPQPLLPAGAAPTRDPAAALPSVARRSRRSALVVIAAFTTACAVALVGLAAVVVTAVAVLAG